MSEYHRASIRAFNGEGMYANNIGGIGQGPGKYRLFWMGDIVGPTDSVYLRKVYIDHVIVYDPNDFSFVRHVTVEDAGIKEVSGIVGIVEAGWVMSMRAILFSRRMMGE